MVIRFPGDVGVCSRWSSAMQTQNNGKSWFEWLMIIIAGLGFLGMVMIDPDVPGDELTNREMLTVYSILGAMVIVPAIVQHIMGWNWFSDLPPKKSWPTKTTISTGQTYMGWLQWRGKR